MCRFNLIQRGLVTGILSAVSSSASALPPTYPTGSTENSAFYYQIGGASSIMEPTHVFASSTTLDGSIELGLGYSCGKFDPIAGLKNSVAKVSAITDAIAAALKAAIAALPMLIIQRVNPGLYDLLQNLIIKGEAVLALANTSCEQMEREIKKGNNPYEAWTDLSKMIDWKVEMKSGNRDVAQAKDYVEGVNGDKGVPWIGGSRAGGAGQPVIKVTRDVVKAGYNLHLNRAVTDASPYSSSSGGGKPRLADVWPSPQAAADWAAQVVGDIAIATYDEHPEQSSPGMGLLPSIKTDQLVIAERLVQLVNGSQSTDLAHLKGVSSNDVLITAPIIKTLQTLSPTEQRITLNKLASEVAMSINFEKMIFLRRLLLTGKREPNVIKTAAINHVDEAIRELDREVDEVILEKRIHHELLSDTAGLLLGLQHQHQNRGNTQQREAGQDLQPLVDGAIQ